MKSWQVNTLLCTVSILFCFALLEFGIRILPDSEENEVVTQTGGTYYSKSYFQKHPELGYAPEPNRIVQSTLHQNGKLVYDVQYTIDSQGLRATPSAATPGQSFAFFGCSFTFGEGVEDEETLPAQFSSQLTLNNAQVLNFGFHGYGPHQMLRAIETKILDQASSAPLKTIYYQGAPWHMQRAFGLSPWDLRGPQYVYHKNNLEYRGHFHTVLGAKLIDYSTRYLASIRFIQDKWLALKGREKTNLLNRYQNILLQARQEAQEKYNASFKVIFWDEEFIINDQDLTPKIITFLDKENFEYIKVSDIFQTEDFNTLLMADGHPTAHTHAKIADYLMHSSFLN